MWRSLVHPRCTLATKILPQGALEHLFFDAQTTEQDVHRCWLVTERAILRGDESKGNESGLVK
jgi:hypothetical protein